MVHPFNRSNYHNNLFYSFHSFIKGINNLHPSSLLTRINKILTSSNHKQNIVGNPNDPFPSEKFRTIGKNPGYWTGRANVNPTYVYWADEKKESLEERGRNIRIYAHNKQWPTTRQKCRTQTRGSLFFFSPRIARMQRAEPGCSPFQRGRADLWKWWPPRRRRKAKAYRGGICVQRYLSPHPYMAPSLIREGTHVPSPFRPFLHLPSARSTAPSFLHVNPLAVQCTYIRIYIYMYFIQYMHIFQSRVSKPSWPRNTEIVRNFLFESLETVKSTYLLSSLLF